MNDAGNMDDLNLANMIDNMKLFSKEKKKRMGLQSGDLVYIDRTKFFTPLPTDIRRSIEEVGYSSRFYDIPPVLLASIIETFLEKNVEENAINGYMSSVKKQFVPKANLVYFARTHLIIKPIVEEFLGVPNDEITETATIVVYDHHVQSGQKIIDGSVVLISSDDIMRYDQWIDAIHDLYVHQKLPWRNIHGTINA